MKIYDKMDLSLRMRLIYKVKHRCAIRLKVVDQFVTCQIDLVPKVKVCILSMIKENLLLCCRMFSAFVVIVLI